MGFLLMVQDLSRDSWAKGAELLLGRAWNKAVNNLRVDGRVPSSFGIPPELERVVSKVLVKPTKPEFDVSENAKSQ
jgi:hypothetical protein